MEIIELNFFLISFELRKYIKFEILGAFGNLKNLN